MANHPMQKRLRLAQKQEILRRNKMEQQRRERFVKETLNKVQRQIAGKK
jgi:hypothetical protein